MGSWYGGRSKLYLRSAQTDENASNFAIISTEELAQHLKYDDT
jgi:hypothetical protein